MSREKVNSLSPHVTLPSQGMELCLVVMKNLSGIPLNGVTMVMFSSPGVMCRVRSAVRSFPFALPEKVIRLAVSVVSKRRRVPPFS